MNFHIENVPIPLSHSSPHQLTSLILFPFFLVLFPSLRPSTVMSHVFHYLLLFSSPPLLIISPHLIIPFLLLCPICICSSTCRCHSGFHIWEKRSYRLIFPSLASFALYDSQFHPFCCRCHDFILPHGQTIFLDPSLCCRALGWFHFLVLWMVNQGTYMAVLS